MMHTADRLIHKQQMVITVSDCQRSKLLGQGKDAYFQKYVDAFSFDKNKQIRKWISFFSYEILRKEKKIFSAKIKD